MNISGAQIENKTSECGKITSLYSVIKASKVKCNEVTKNSL